MQTQGIDSEPDPEASSDETSERFPDQRKVESVVLILLLSGGQEGPWTRAELELELSAAPLDVQDAIAGLHGAGLVHLQGALVFASRAAQRMDELDL